jgi:PhnB protein
MSEVSAIPCGHHTVTPYLIVKGAREAIAFYEKAFGATDKAVMDGPDGGVMHAELKIGDSFIFLTEECTAYGNLGPLSIGGTPVSLHLYVEGVDAAFAKAVGAGATVLMPLMDMFWGDRFCKLSDPFGHHWSLAQHMEDVTPEQMKERGAAAMAAMCPPK